MAIGTNIRLLALSSIGTTLTAHAPSTAITEGQQFQVTGRLTKDNTGEGIPNSRINIYVNDQFDNFDTTDLNGDYAFNLVIDVPGDYTLTVEYTGGECVTGCITTCVAGCISACIVGCVVSCVVGCTVGCIESCIRSCIRSCIASCTAPCTASCIASCIASCTVSCTVGCVSGCIASCIESCVVGCIESVT